MNYNGFSSQKLSTILYFFGKKSIYLPKLKDNIQLIESNGNIIKFMA